jgi:hypothetical protein
MMKPQPRIVCAAIRSESGKIILGIRHYSQDMHDQLAHRNDAPEFWHHHDQDQGFVDQWGNYLTREQAYVIAEQAGQIIKPECCSNNRLYSEALY